MHILPIAGSGAALLLAALSLTPGSRPAQEAQESTVSGRHLGAILAAINTRDSGALLRFGRDRYAPKALAESGGEPRLLVRWLEIATSYGPLELDSVISTTDTVTTAWVRGTVSKAWLSFRLLADSAPPHGVLRISLGRGLRPPYADARVPVVEEPLLGRHLADYLERMAGADLFSGVVLIAKGDRQVVARTHGFADRERRTPLRLDTPFDIASVGKLFTAVAIGQLAERGALRLTDTIGKYVPELPSVVGRRITIAQLLEHSSGLGELGPGIDSVMRRAKSVTEMVAVLTDTTLAFPPGSSFLYSNRGYVILGAIVERASGRAYTDYVRQEIFTPAGMSSTALVQATALPGNRAHRYTHYPTLRSGWTPGPRMDFPPELDLAPGPHGGAQSTAEDLVRFAAALTGGRLLSEAMVRRLTVPDVGTGRSLGFQIGGGGRGNYFGHAGGAPGMNSMLRIFPQLGYTVVVLSNDDAGANLAGAYITELLR